METYLIGKFKLKRRRSSWKMKLIVGVVFEYDNDDNKIETEIFIQNFNKKINIFWKLTLMCVCVCVCVCVCMCVCVCVCVCVNIMT